MSKNCIVSYLSHDSPWVSVKMDSSSSLWLNIRKSQQYNGDCKTTPSWINPLLESLRKQSQRIKIRLGHLRKPSVVSRRDCQRLRGRNFKRTQGPRNNPKMTLLQSGRECWLVSLSAPHLRTLFHLSLPCPLLSSSLLCPFLFFLPFSSFRLCLPFPPSVFLPHNYGEAAVNWIRKIHFFLANITSKRLSVRRTKFTRSALCTMPPKRQANLLRISFSYI